MRMTLLRTATTAGLALALTAGGVVTASAASTYKCNTSRASIDDPSYSGPWADNWDFTTKVCAKRSGSLEQRR
ncbi:hypothetical protein [Streptomyces sp. NPDC056672]|uniref:hypothetical protein n=1 Tax=Streptomyces sp. NPDC056672 TaxID=3345906 RepID=UPI0036A85224